MYERLLRSFIDIDLVNKQENMDVYRFEAKKLDLDIFKQYDFADM